MRSWLIAFALFATPVLADPPEGELRAAPGSIATGMIEAASADGVFEIVHNGQVSVRHLGSGMRCDFAHEGGRIVIFPTLARGDDVACDSQENGVYVTLYATRYPFASTAEEQASGAAAAIRQRFPDAQPAPITHRIESDTLPPHSTAQFLIMRDGVRQFTSVNVAMAGPWTIKLRYTAPARTDAEAQQAELAANLLFASTLTQIVAPPAP
ncbi:MAG: hypothetical protein J0L81_15110 [Caulobacterales bacterium]|jgi:hypothetical protein|nr:hypothetical protein [Caulobacterales bacterium]